MTKTTMTTRPKQKKFDWSILGCAGHINNMFKVNVMFELDTDFTVAAMSLPEPLVMKIKVSHEWGGNKYMVCQTIITQEMTRDDLIELVTGIRKFMDGEQPKDYEQEKRRALWPSSKKNQNEKIMPTLALSDPSQKE